MDNLSSPPGDCGRYPAKFGARNMTPDEVRSAFLQFCGASQCRKFAHSLVKLPDAPDAEIKFDRLRYWQETLWAKFLLEFPDAPIAVDTIGSCLHWCDVHDQSLVMGAGHQPVDLRRSDSFNMARKNEFPFGYGWLGHHCPECRNSCIEWIASHPDQCRMLQYLVHDAAWVASHRKDQEFLNACRDAYIPVDEMREGDEIWMINTGRGPDSLALVRDGTIVPIVD